MLRFPDIPRAIIAAGLIAALPIPGTAAPSVSGPSANPFGIWAYMGGMPTLSQTPHVRGKLVKAAWADLEPQPGAWTWNSVASRQGANRANRSSVMETESSLGFDSELAAAAKANLQIIVVVFSGSHSPAWIYDRGVPKVKTTGVRGVQRDTYPYYLNPTYQELFHTMITRVREHLEGLPPEVRSHILAVQAGFSSTGDFYPYHGTLVDEHFAISDEDWMAYYQKMALVYQQEYRNTSPRIRLLFNPSNDPAQAEPLIDWLKEHAPHAFIKAGNTGHMYQINGEREQIRMLRAQLFAPAADGDFLRARSEFGEDSETGAWLEAPAWNMYSLLQAALYTGLDINCMERGDTVLADRSYFPAFEFYNRYAGQKDPAKAPGAWSALRDGLDASDTQRFPEKDFGPAKLENKERFLKIADTFAARGARQGDPQGGMITGINNRRINALNDVGWRIYSGNYEVFLEQIEPAATSVGYWRVGPKTQPYGRYARGFEHATGRDALYFRVDPRFVTAGDPRKLQVRVVYFDGGRGHWALLYAGARGAMTLAADVQKHGTNQWQELTVSLDGAQFGGKGPRGCDLQLKNTDAEDDIFELVEISRVPQTP